MPRLLRLVLALALVWVSNGPAHASLELNLSYVDQSSTAWQRFISWVDTALGGSPPYGFSAFDAVLAYRVTGAAAYRTLAIATVEEQVSTAEAAIAAGGRPAIAGDSYLEVGPLLQDLAFVYAWCGGSLTPTQRQRWEAYADQAVWNVWNPSLAHWGGQAFPWSGWSIDNPGNNYHYSFLLATMSWALAANRPSWLDFLEDVKLPALVAYYAALPGGGSREGTGYGTAQMRLFELYRIWRDSTPTHVDLGAASSHLVDTLDYWIHATVPTLDRYAPIGDLSRESYPWLYDYHRNLVLQARAMVPFSAAADRASWWLGEIAIHEMGSGFNLRHDLLSDGAVGAPPTARVHHAVATGHLFARTDWSESALWLSFVGGELSESHAHQEQGSFTLFQGDFLAVPENVFSHSGIVQEPEAHNTLRFVNAGATLGQEQSTSVVTTQEAAGALLVAADLTPVHASSGLVSSWHRNLEFDATGLEVRDTFSVGAGVEAVFQVNTPTMPGVLGQEATTDRLRVRVLSPANAVLSVVDWHQLDPAEFSTGFRLEIRGSTTEYVVRLEPLALLFADGFESGDLGGWSLVVP